MADSASATVGGAGKSDEAAEARALAASIPDDALESALSVGTTRVASQNQTLGNIRARTSALLPTSAVSVTFATSVGLIAKDPVTGEGGLPGWAAIAVLLLVLAIGVVTIVVQWPASWDYDSGTEVYRNTANKPAALRAAIAELEVAVVNNRQRLDRLFGWFEAGVFLLAVETILVVVGLMSNSSFR